MTVLDNLSMMGHPRQVQLLSYFPESVQHILVQMLGTASLARSAYCSSKD